MTSRARLPSAAMLSRRGPRCRDIGRLGGEPARAGARAGHHSRQRLADLVGDRGRQLAQRREPRHVRQLHLRLGQRLLRAPFLGDVRGDAAAAVGPSPRVADQGAAAVDPACLAVGPDDAERHVEPLVAFARQPASPRGSHVVPVLRMDSLDPGFRVVLHIAERASPDLLVPRAHVQHAPRRDRLGPDDFRDGLGHEPETPLAFLERALDAPPGSR